LRASHPPRLSLSAGGLAETGFKKKEAAGLSKSTCDAIDSGVIWW
jgi:hypothetical protein